MSEQWWYETENGRWTANAIRLIPEGEPVFEGLPRRGYMVSVGGRKVGTMRRQIGANQGWMLRIDGYEWRVTPSMGAHRFGLQWTPCHLVKGANEARKELRDVLASRFKK